MWRRAGPDLARARRSGSSDVTFAVVDLETTGRLPRPRGPSRRSARSRSAAASASERSRRSSTRINRSRRTSPTSPGSTTGWSRRAADRGDAALVRGVHPRRPCSWRTTPRSTLVPEREPRPPRAPPRSGADRLHGEARPARGVARRPERAAGHPRAVLPHARPAFPPRARRRRGHGRGARRPARPGGTARDRHRWASSFLACSARGRPNFGKIVLADDAAHGHRASTCSARATGASSTSASPRTCGRA